MATEWFIGTLRDDPPDEEGKRHSTVDLAVQITEEEHRALREAERVIRETLRGVLLRLVFANHRALKDHEAQLLELLTRGDRRKVDWFEAHLQTQLALANWLISVRWLLDHTSTRLHKEPDKLKQFEEAKSREFDRHFAYRLTYNLRDYATHCDLPPVSMHVESRAVGVGGRTDRLSIQLQPGHLLKTWNGWKARIKSDLTARSEPIDLIPLVDEAMACIERVMVGIISADDRDRQEASLSIVGAVERLTKDVLKYGATPVLFAAEIEGGVIRSVSPTPLPITEASVMLKASASH